MQPLERVQPPQSRAPFLSPEPPSGGGCPTALSAGPLQLRPSPLPPALPQDPPAASSALLRAQGPESWAWWGPHLPRPHFPVAPDPSMKVGWINCLQTWVVQNQPALFSAEFLPPHPPCRPPPTPHPQLEGRPGISKFNQLVPPALLAPSVLRSPPGSPLPSRKEQSPLNII